MAALRIKMIGLILTLALFPMGTLFACACDGTDTDNDDNNLLEQVQPTQDTY